MSVYVIRVTDSDGVSYVKVGRSDDLVTRISTIQKGLPLLIDSGFSISASKKKGEKPKRNTNNFSSFGGTTSGLDPSVDDGVIEKLLHKLFSASHRWGEWYDASYGDMWNLFSKSSPSSYDEVDFRTWFLGSGYKESFDFTPKHKREVREAIDELSTHFYTSEDIKSIIDIAVSKRLRNSNYDDKPTDDLFS